MKKIFFGLKVRFDLFLFSKLQTHRSVLNAYRHIEQKNNTDNALLKEELAWTLYTLSALKNNLKEYQFEILNNQLAAVLLYKLKEMGYVQAYPTTKFFQLKKQMEECFRIRIFEMESEEGLYLEKDGKQPLVIKWRDRKMREELRKKIALLDIIISNI